MIRTPPPPQPRYSPAMMGTSPNPSHPPNFIIFGEMGVGKSSLINLIAGKDVTKTSSGAQSCTLDSTEHTINLTDYQLNVHLYDTAGLNEPTMTNANYVDALVKAHKLIQSLQEKGGIHGLLFCMRGRISNTVQQNYRLFYEFLCQKQVPVALVINGLENEPNMDDWWTQNEVHFKTSGIASVNHVCITSIKGHGNAYEERYLESRKKVHKMLNELAYGTAYSADTTGWFGRMCKKLREFLVPGSKVSWLGKSHDKMMKELTKRCKLCKEDAAQLIRGMESND